MPVIYRELQGDNRAHSCNLTPVGLVRNPEPQKLLPSHRPPPLEVPCGCLPASRLHWVVSLTGSVSFALQLLTVRSPWELRHRWVCVCGGVWDPASSGWKGSATFSLFLIQSRFPFSFHSNYNNRLPPWLLHSLSQYAVTTNWCWRVTKSICPKPPSTTGWWRSHRVPVLPGTQGEPSHQLNRCKEPGPNLCFPEGWIVAQATNPHILLMDSTDSTWENRSKWAAFQGKPL